MESPDNFKIEEYEIKRLMANPNFIKSAVELRQKLCLEPEGFTTNKEQNAWNERQSKKDKERFDLAVHHLITDFELVLSFISLRIIPTFCESNRRMA